jgi:sodium-dependent dicarboxylate transporter 2/3/5
VNSHAPAEASVAATRPTWRRALYVLGALTVAAGATLLPLDLPDAARLCLGIFIFAVVLFATEWIPPFATALLIIVLCIFVLGRPGGPMQLERTGSNSFRVFLNPVADPVLVLFFGGLVLARAAAKHGLDARLARIFLRPFGRRPAAVLLGVVATSAVFSMFMSYIAATAMMLAVLGPLWLTQRVRVGRSVRGRCWPSRCRSPHRSARWEH